ncbi:alpha/beta fold hydrolase [Marinihelvus fidelis]|uniref:Alpha/beta fold hydrolase n=1 Tax=Marinihelvus fidelis TaxID=2613842 RepID=A0A5N0T9U4_9GAMM|nr:alpha/beta hydrolase [Marinihelvus fidelis]KAA9130897.1 alpha/beta fold hydrolase [Marinihelvus fidelis]
MTTTFIRTLGEIAVYRDGESIKLPASRKTRALLGYLALTARPHRRERLCDLFWEAPDDPRGALRWSLSKIRPLVNDTSVQRLEADRERAALKGDELSVDLHDIAAELDAAELPVTRLEAIVALLGETVLDGCDLPDQSLFQEWLVAERRDAERLRARALQRLGSHPDLMPDRALSVIRTWSELEPFSTDAANHLVTRLTQAGREIEATTAREEFSARFQKAGIDWVPQPGGAVVPPAAPDPITTARQYQARQKIQFCTASDRVRIAYASVGEGPPIIKAANWLSHLELDWDAPIWSPLLRQLAVDHQVVRYDERGNGLSDWQVDDISFEAFVTDLETVVEATGLEKFALLGISQGAAVSIEYAVRHPERVSKLVLFGGYPAGWRIDASDEQIREREAIMTLTASGWGADNPAYRQIFSSTFMPDATAEEFAWFNDFQRATTSPENAVRFLSAFGDIDVRDRLAQVRVPTLVIHSQGDQRIPARTGREIAASIPDAEFLGLDSDGHLLLGREPASQAFVGAVHEFLTRD